MTGQGKSKEAFKIIRNEAPCLVFDVNNEYGIHPKNKDWSLNLSTDNRLQRSRYIGGDMEVFLELVKTRTNTIIVFEEATGFFKGAIGKELARMVINKRHTKNNYIFLFHSIRSIPPALLDFMNYVILFNTADSMNVVKGKHENFVQPFMKLKKGAPPPLRLQWIAQ